MQIELSARDGEGRFVPGCLPDDFLPGGRPGKAGGDGRGRSALIFPCIPARAEGMFNGLLLAAVMVEGKGEVLLPSPLRRRSCGNSDLPGRIDGGSESLCI